MKSRLKNTLPLLLRQIDVEQGEPVAWQQDRRLAQLGHAHRPQVQGAQQ